jgi:hypothetical protein
LHLCFQGIAEKPDGLEYEASRELGTHGPNRFRFAGAHFAQLFYARFCFARFYSGPLGFAFLPGFDPALPHLRNPEHFR